LTSGLQAPKSLRMNWNEKNGLKFVEALAKDSKSAVVLFHGYGADAGDLYPFKDAFGFENVDWYFPQGVMQVPVGPHTTGRGWFSIEDRDWGAFQSGVIEDKPFTTDQLRTVEIVTGFLNDLGRRYESVIFGGFSQGAILSSHTFYRTEFTPKGLLFLSGYLVGPSQFPTLSPAHQGIPFLQSHGRQDEVLPLAGAKKLRTQLSTLGLKGDLQVFEGGHEIPIEIQKTMKSFITNRL